MHTSQISLCLTLSGLQATGHNERLLLNHEYVLPVLLLQSVSKEGGREGGGGEEGFLAGDLKGYRL